MPPRGPGTGGLRREQAPVPCAAAMASDHALPRELATTQQAGADGQQRAVLRREGDGTRSWGLISSSSSHVLHGTSGGLSSGAYA